MKLVFCGTGKKPHVLTWGVNKDIQKQIVRFNGLPMKKENQ